MKKKALQTKFYKEAEPPADSVQPGVRRYPTPIPLRRTKSRSHRTDEVDLSKEGSTRFVQDHLESEISRQFEEAFGEFYLDSDDLEEMDLSPEATAERIFDISKSHFENWRDQNPEMSEEELIDSFEEAVRAAIDQGYERAVDIFSGVEIDDGVLESAVETVSILHKLLSEYCVDLFAQLDEREV
jgi:hypothetical protein